MPGTTRATSAPSAKPISGGVAAQSGATVDGELVKAYRKRRNWKRKDLARHAGITFQAVARLERNPCIVTTTTLCGLARALEVPIAALLSQDVELPERRGSHLAFPGLQSSMAELLDELREWDDPAQQLSALARQLAQARSERKARHDSLAKEEEILGRWLSLIASYESANWARMIKHADALVELAMELRRPHLAALARAYAVKARRNKATTQDKRKARERFDRIPETRDSFLILRLRGKLLIRDGRLQEAMRCFQDAHRIAKNQDDRDDCLYVLERAKLFRNLASCHMRLAHPPEYDPPPEPLSPDANEHLCKARDRLEQCAKAIPPLKQHCPQAHLVETMLLWGAKARLARLRREYSTATGNALKAEAVARAAGADYGLVKMRMMRLLCYCENNDHQKAQRLYARLEQERPNFTLPLEDAYRKILARHRQALTRRAPAKRSTRCPSKWPQVYRPVEDVTREEQEAILKFCVDQFQSP